MHANIVRISLSIYNNIIIKKHELFCLLRGIVQRHIRDRIVGRKCTFRCWSPEVHERLIIMEEVEPMRYKINKIFYIKN